MDKETNIQELKDKVKEFCELREWDQFHNPKDLSISITIEAAELLEIFRLKNEKEIKEIMNGSGRENVEDEVADILFNLLRFAQKNGIDITTALHNKMEKSNKKYPIEKAKGNNKKYSEY
jgi:NTP pyrophosphatase (non-canonical NTP hydrolase)